MKGDEQQFAQAAKAANDSFIQAIYDVHLALERMRAYGMLGDGQLSVLLSDPDDGRQMRLAADPTKPYVTQSAFPMPDVLVEFQGDAKRPDPMIYRQCEFFGVRFLWPTRRWATRGGGFE